MRRTTERGVALILAVVCMASLITGCDKSAKGEPEIPESENETVMVSEEDMPFGILSGKGKVEIDEKVDLLNREVVVQNGMKRAQMEPLEL